MLREGLYAQHVVEAIVDVKRAGPDEDMTVLALLKEGAGFAKAELQVPVFARTRW